MSTQVSRVRVANPNLPLLSTQVSSKQAQLGGVAIYVLLVYLLWLHLLLVYLRLVYLLLVFLLWLHLL